MTLGVQLSDIPECVKRGCVLGCHGVSVDVVGGDKELHWVVESCVEVKMEGYEVSVGVLIPRCLTPELGKKSAAALQPEHATVLSGVPSGRVTVLAPTFLQSLREACAAALLARSDAATGFQRGSYHGS